MAGHTYHQYMVDDYYISKVSFTKKCVPTFILSIVYNRCLNMINFLKSNQAGDKQIIRVEIWKGQGCD